MFFKKKKPVRSEAVLSALNTVILPSLKKDIVTLGMVGNLKIEDGKVHFALKLPPGTGLQGGAIRKQAEEVVSGLSGVESVEVHLHTSDRKEAAPTQGGRLQLPDVKNVIAVCSGKGGVGKSTVTINLAVALAKLGARVGLLDADIYGPSIPLMMGLSGKPSNGGAKLKPLEREGIKVMSIGFVTDDKKPVVWRGPMVHGALTQFMSQVDWGKLDYLLIDMPPGTGDAQLTIGQTFPLTGVVIVTTPQEISLIDARKGLLMFENLQIKVLGIVENMSGFVSPESGKVVNIFGEGGGQRLAEETKSKFLGKIPIEPQIVVGGDTGNPIALSDPTSQVGKSFYTIAREVQRELNVAVDQLAGEFQPLSLEWH